MGDCVFFRNGVTMACLKESGKVPVERHRLIRLVIGGRRTGRQDLRSLVGMESSVQVASEDDRMASETSAEEAGWKSRSGGGGERGGG